MPGPSHPSEKSLATEGILNGRGGEIRTRDLLVPNQALYQAKLHPETPAWDSRGAGMSMVGMAGGGPIFGFVSA